MAVSVDLVKCGVYRYCDSDVFEILLFAYAVDDKEAQIIDLASGEKISEEIVAAITDPQIIKTA
jgi:DNA polymerase